MSKMNVAVIGTGMYVCGRGTNGYGTIMPALCQAGDSGKIGEIFLAGRSVSGVARAKAKIKELSSLTGAKLKITFLPEGRNNMEAYKEAFRKIPRPASAIIAVPDAMHKEIAKAALEQGLHTLVVKPLVANVKDALDLVKAQKMSGVYCAVEFHKRFDLANLKLKDTIRSGSIGDVLYFLVEYSQRKSIPSVIFKDWVSGTNIFQYLGIHYVDIIYFCTGAMPVRAMAVGQKNWLVSKGINTYDAIESTIEWKSPSGRKFISHIAASWVDPESTTAMSDQKIKVIGTKGRFESDQKSRGITIVTDGKGAEEPNPYFCAEYPGQDRRVYRGYGIDSICQFLDDAKSVEDGSLKVTDLEGRRPTFRDSIAPTAALEAVNKSLKKNGAWIDIKNT